MANRKIGKVAVTWAGPDWQPKIAASLKGPLANGLTVSFCPDRAAALREIADADCAYVSTFDQELLQAGKRLQWIHFMRGGVDNVMFPELVRSRIVVTCLKELFAEPGAEYALMAMLMVQRRTTWAVGRPKLPQSAGALDLTLKPADLRGTTVAVLGLGNIGRRIADLCRAFGMKVLGLARRRPDEAVLLDTYYPPDRAAEMLAEADFAILALPFTTGTAGWFDARLVAALKLGAWLIDVSARPQLLDYEALRGALASGRLGGIFLQPCGASLPGLPTAEDSIWKLDNVVVTPCRCGSAQQLENSVALFPENLRRWESGLPLSGVVDKAAGY